MEEKIKQKIKELNEIWDKYEKLSQKTFRYRWRQHGIEAQINILEVILYDKKDRWEECLKEDTAEAKREGWLK